IVVVDRSGRIVQVNAQTERLFGYSRQELNGCSVHLLVPPARRARHLGLFEGFFSGPGPTQRPMTGHCSQISGVRKDGSEFAAEISLSTLVSDGQTLGLAFVRDTTVQRRNEQTIRKSEAYFRLLSRAAEKLSRSLDYRQTLRSIAEVAIPDFADWCVVVGLGPDGELGELVSSQRADVRPELVAEFCRGYRAACDDPASLFSRARRERLPLRTEFELDAALRDRMPPQAVTGLSPSSLLYVPLVARERVIGVLCCCTGIREPYGEEERDVALDLGHRAAMALESALLLVSVEQARDAAQRAADARDQVLSIVAHDLRTPLNAIALSAQQLIFLSGRDGAAPARKPAELIRSSTRQMGLLIDDLLARASFEAGVLKFEPATHLADEIVADVVAGFAPMAVTRELSLTATTTDAGTVRCDRLRISQVLGNLVSNAFNFTAPGGAISIQVCRGPEAMTFTVTDTGSGISPESCARVFDRNWYEPIDKPHGLGLGLYIAKLLVGAHGGQISVQSQVGVGSTFTFWLPLQPLQGG
ncbi:MAG: Sensory box histidine kinase, partial [Myxococcaceae bacterium]|nr:Sensory box histidine kinase [Myxococcaceae bacterium]